jgi:hypothetical protein
VELLHNSIFFHAGLDELVPRLIRIWFRNFIFDSVRKKHADILKEVIVKITDTFNKDWKIDNGPETAGRRVRSEGIKAPNPRTKSIIEKFRKSSGGLTGKDLR